MSVRSRDFRNLVQLIERVYDAAIDDAGWDGLAPVIAQTFQSDSTALQIHRGDSDAVILSMTENVRSRIDEYRAYYWQRDVWVERALDRELPCIAASKDLVTDAEFQETEFYRDWCRYLDVFYIVGALFPAGSDALAVLGIHRSKSAGSYSDASTSLVAMFLPHLQRALRVRDKLRHAATHQCFSLEALDRIDTAAFLLVADGRILFSNKLGEQLLTIGRGIRSQNGHLVATTVADSMQLERLLREAHGVSIDMRSRQGVMAIQCAGGRSLHLLVAPLRHTLAGLQNPAAVVFVRDSARKLEATATLRALYGLTPTEAQVAQALVNGMTLGEIAAARRASVQTVRTQLKGIFGKTGTTRQAELVGVILRSVASMGDALAESPPDGTTISR